MPTKRKTQKWKNKVEKERAKREGRRKPDKEGALTMVVLRAVHYNWIGEEGGEEEKKDKEWRKKRR